MYLFVHVGWPSLYLFLVVTLFLPMRQVVEDRKAGMPPGPGGGHEHIHCSLKVLDADQVPPQVAIGEGIGGGGEQGRAGDRPLVVVAAKYYFNGDADVVFRYRLYSFHACPVRDGTKNEYVLRVFNTELAGYNGYHRY